MSAESSRAVFLSYASQDAEAARRICAALRAAGIEVWFDQSELVGGDAWDQKIRKQIKECALFLPVISAATQARREGYFRIEWKLAAQRTHAFADGTPFLLPVVIDETRDADALVPEEFRAVQWTRLFQGETPPKFCERVQRLLGGEAAGAPSRRAESREVPRKAASTKSQKWRAAIGAAFVLVGLALWQPWKTSPSPSSNSKPQTPNTKPTAPASDKSIAVLPFKNQSQEKDSAFFTDGVHEDVLTNLFNIRELRVVSRTSVEQYRGTTKTMKQIGAELGVAYILEGSVQRVGDKVRVTGQLIDARTDGHLWAKAFDEKLSDVFVIQASIAKAIAAELKTVLSPEERKLVERRATVDSAAYDLYLKAREIGRGSIRALEERQTLLEDALKLDPNFARAWSSLALVRFQLVRRDYSRLQTFDERAAKAKEAVDAAVRLAPDAPETLLCLGDYYYRIRRDYPRALEYLERMRRLQPNDPDAHAFIGYVQRRQGHWAESTANLRKAVQLDPANYPHLLNFAGSLKVGRRYDELIALFGRFRPTRSSGSMESYFSALGTGSGKNAEIAYVHFLATGSTREMEDVRASVPPEQLNTPAGIAARKRWASLTGDFAEAIALDRLQPYAGDGDPMLETVYAALTLAAHGDRDGARARLGNSVSELRARLAAEPDNEVRWSYLARVEVVLGNNEEALRCARKAVELVPESIDAAIAPFYRQILASVYAWSGDKDRALAELAYVLRTPYFPPVTAISVHVARRSPDFFPLRGDPRFEALVNDPKNNAPLF